MNQMKKWISENIVVLFFCMLCIAAYTIAGQNPYVVASDLINRVMGTVSWSWPLSYPSLPVWD